MSPRKSSIPSLKSFPPLLRRLIGAAETECSQGHAEALTAFIALAQNNRHGHGIFAPKVGNELASPDNIECLTKAHFSRESLTRGNPIDRQYDINANLGGPLWPGKAWFFYRYRLNDQYKHTLGIDELARSKLTNAYTFKGTFQLNRTNQLIGFLNKREKLQELRDLGPLVPISAARYQSSRNYPWK